ncbi:MAG TPA: LysE family transporter [Aliidongia sp.]|uniref:LysE family translocator n=1 Tax=Aliidongia sp. TaxID=1914230 RepID=UPI002DDD86DA|nr:LysE family transporter [Aliidongia sp.]HEV2673940.1 LysE family transporter [Aliidongia sp.]
MAFGLFMISAVSLLGSPGPGIAALIAVGRTAGLARGLRYYAGLQVGLAAASGLCAVGLFSLLTAFPGFLRALTIVATIYLVYLAYKIATAPVGSALQGRATSSRPIAGFLLGITNPKAYVAFVSLLASQSILAGAPTADLLVKWLLMVAAMIVVDIAWLLVGVALHQAILRPATERALNLGLGAMILGAAAISFL